MKRSIVFLFLLLFGAGLRAQEPAGPTCPANGQPVFDISPDPLPPLINECNPPPGQPRNWDTAKACLDALVAKQPRLFPGAVIGYQVDGVPMQVYAKGAGFANDSVATLGSVSKPLVYVALVKLIQDHYASPACTPAITPRCVFPQKFETPLPHALRVIDEQRGTDVLTRWYNNVVTDDNAQQRAWKSAVKIRHIAQMTGGWPEIAFTGYRFCPDGVCPPTEFGDITCDPAAPVPPGAPNDCRNANLYAQYLNRRGGDVVIPPACRPRPGTGPRLFNFCDYYNGRVDHPERLARAFERRYSHEPGLLGECVLQDDAGGKRWLDGRTIPESDYAKFSLGMPLISEPGTEYHYSQPNLYIAAYLIEGVSRQRFDDYIKAQLLDPLNMADTSFVVRPGTPQYQRLLDIKRVPASPVRVLPDLAPPVRLDTIFGADKNWDEPRTGWENRWPEGGAYSTAADLLRFLRFVRTGKAPDGRVLLNAESLLLVTSARGPVGPRTYAFRSTDAGALVGTSYFGPLIRRDAGKCRNFVVLMQTVIESAETVVGQVPLGDYQRSDVHDRLRGQLIRMLEDIPTPCNPGSPIEP